MLIRIEKTVFNLFSQGLATSQDEQALQYLAMAAMEGGHRISGERETLNLLALRLAALPRHARALRRASERVTEEGNLHKSLSVYGTVTTQSDAATPQSLREGAQRVIRFPLRWFDDSAKVHKTHLLAENVDDASVYRIIGALSASNASLAHVPITIQTGHGSGSNIAAVLQEQIVNHQMVLCLVDSDKLSPQGNIGQTAQSLHRFKDEANYPLLQVEQTTARELENILPDDFYRQAYRRSRHAKMSEFLSSLSERGELDVRAYVDIKKGLRLRDVLEMKQGAPDQNFWLEKLPVLRELVQCSVEMDGCLQAKTCPKASRTSCACEFVPGNSSTPLRHFAERYKDDRGGELRQALGERQNEEWHRLGQLVASWGCGDDVLRI